MFEGGNIRERIIGSGDDVRGEAHFDRPALLLDAQQRSLDCLILEGPDYHTDQSGHDNDELRPSLFPGLSIPLGQLWAE